MAGSGTTALATDVSTPANTGLNVMGTGSLSRGYGQTTFGASKNVGDTITANDFNNIRYDLLNASAHQNGSAAALSLAGNVTGGTINSTDPNAFISYAATVDSDRFNCHSSRKTTIAYGGNSRTSSWAISVSASYSLYFDYGIDQLRYFWNSGGRIRFASSRTGGAASAQNTSWSNLLSSAGTQEFGGAAVYSWGTLPTTLYSISSSAPYASNNYTITVHTTTGVAGPGTIFMFILTWSDPYVDPSPGNPPAPEDIVDGTLAYSVELTYATPGHALTPSGSWQQYIPFTNSSGIIAGG